MEFVQPCSLCQLVPGKIFIIVYTLVDHGLQASFGEGMRTKMELLNHCMVSVQESVKHEADL